MVSLKICPFCGHIETKRPDPRIDETSGSVFINDAWYRLPPNIWRVFMCLWEANGKTVSYDPLLLAVYGNDEPDSAKRTLYVNIHIMRKFFENTDFDIKTIFGVGVVLKAKNIESDQMIPPFNISNMKSFYGRKYRKKPELKLPIIITKDICKLFPFCVDERSAIKLLEEVRWPNGITCTHCGSKLNSKIVGKGARMYLYYCRSCRRQFRVTVGTPFNHWKGKTFAKLNRAICLLTTGECAPSTRQLSFILKVTYSTAMKIVDFIKKRMSIKRQVQMRQLKELESESLSEIQRFQIAFSVFSCNLTKDDLCKKLALCLEKEEPHDKNN